MSVTNNHPQPQGQQPLSNCHRAPVHTAAEGSTHFYACNQCNQPCDLYVEQPQPQGQQPDKGTAQTIVGEWLLEALEKYGNKPYSTHVDNGQPQQPDSDEYQQIQRIYLDWHNGKRPMSGFIRELQQFQEQREQAARLEYAVGLKAFIDKQFAGSTDMNMVKSYVDASIKTLERLAPKRQDSEGGL